jgi:hypothetical protein
MERAGPAPARFAGRPRRSAGRGAAIRRVSRVGLPGYAPDPLAASTPGRDRRSRPGCSTRAKRRAAAPGKRQPAQAPRINANRTSWERLADTDRDRCFHDQRASPRACGSPQWCHGSRHRTTALPRMRSWARSDPGDPFRVISIVRLWVVDDRKPASGLEPETPYHKWLVSSASWLTCGLLADLRCSEIGTDLRGSGQRSGQSWAAASPAAVPLRWDRLGTVGLRRSCMPGSRVSSFGSARCGSGMTG